METDMFRKIAVVLGLVVIVLAALVVWSYSAAIFRVALDEKVVALTYDDGPNPPHTEALLAMLHRHNVKATFFLKGRNVEAFPKEVRTIAVTGHEVGNHSYYHRPMISFNKLTMRSELERTNALIKDQLGYAPVLFRPPYGLQGPGLKLALESLNMTSIIMSDNGADWEVSDPELIASAILETVEPGSIVLLHDGHGDVDDPDSQDSRAATVAATGIIIESLKARGYRFVTVGGLLKAPLIN
jgi:peptidoglycan/xylan/chitin deacetylase (PgdA/CDA1 family)